VTQPEQSGCFEKKRVVYGGATRNKGADKKADSLL
jgi:hypothetical protein